MKTSGTQVRVGEEFLDPGVDVSGGVVVPDEVPGWLLEAERGGVSCLGGHPVTGPVEDLGGAEYAAGLADADAHLGAGPAEELADGLGAAGVGLGRAGSATGELVRVFDEGLVAGVEAVGQLRARLEGVGFALAQ